MDFRKFFAVGDAWFEEDRELVEFEGKPTLTPPVIPQEEEIVTIEYIWTIDF